MGFLELLTVIFIVLKLTGTVAWTWWAVLSPLLVAVGLYLLAFILTTLFGSVATVKALKEIKKNRK